MRLLKPILPMMMKLRIKARSNAGGLKFLQYLSEVKKREEFVNVART